jgi:hypothetical protein
MVRFRLSEVKIDYSIKWQNNHWRTIESAYRKAPFFEYYSDELKKIIYDEHIFSLRSQPPLLSFCLKSISFKPKLSVSVTYEKSPETPLHDLRSHDSSQNTLFGAILLQMPLPTIRSLAIILQTT